LVHWLGVAVAVGMLAGVLPATPLEMRRKSPTP